TGLGHGEVVLHAEQDGVHVHDLFEHPHLEVAVLTAGDRHGAVVPAGAVHAAVLVAVGLELLEAGVPVHIFAVLVVAAGAADAFGVESDAGPGVGHGTFFAVTHGDSPFIQLPAGRTVSPSFSFGIVPHLPRRRKGAAAKFAFAAARTAGRRFGRAPGRPCLGPPPPGIFFL